MKYIIPVLFLLLRTLLITYGQTSVSTQDSLLNSLTLQLNTNTNEDTTKVKLLNNISAKSFARSLKDALKYAQQARDLGDKLNFIKGSADARKNIALYYLNKVDYPKSLKYYNEALKLYKRINNLNRVSLCLNNIGIIYKNQGDYAKSIETHHEALKIRKLEGNKYGISSSIANIGIVFYMQGNYSKAIEYYLEALKINEEIGDKAIIAKTTNNLGIIFQKQGDFPKALEYYQKALVLSEAMGEKGESASNMTNIGIIYYLINDYTSALEYYNKALIIDEERGDKTSIAILSTGIGTVYEKQKDYTNALENYQKSLKLRKETGDKHGVANSYNNIGSLYFHLNEYSKAKILFKKALKIGNEIGSPETICLNSNMLALINLKQGNLNEAYNFSKKAYLIATEIGNVKLQKESADVLSQSSAVLGHYKEAYNYHIYFKNMADSMLSESNIKEITNLQNQFDFEKEKQAIALEQQRKEIVFKEETRRQALIKNVFIIGFFIVSVFVIIILYFYRKIKTANIKLIEQNAIILKQKEEKELLVREIHHRVKNNLQIISSLFDLQMRGTDNSETKAALIDGLNRVKSVGLIHQLLYQNDDVINIKFENFVNKLVDHIISFSSDKPIEQSLNIPKELYFDIETTLPLGLIITELLTNAFKYAFNEVDICSISINFETIEDNRYKLEISDNGSGLPKEFDFNTSKSLGLRLVRTLSKQLSGKVEYKYENGAKFLLMFSKRVPHE